MNTVGRQRAFGARMLRWVTAARALAAVLMLAVAAPGTGLCADLAFHAGAASALTEPAFAIDGSASQEADPGIAAHAHCGCHQAVNLGETAVAPAPGTSRPRYAPMREDPTSIFPTRPARPPRA